MTKKSRNLTRQERKDRNERLLDDYKLLINAGVAKMEAQQILRERYNLQGLNYVGAIIYSHKKSLTN